MNLRIINNKLEEYSLVLSNQKLSEIDWFYEKQMELSKIETLSVAAMEKWLQVTLSSTRTQRYWQREDSRAGELMMKLFAFDPDMTTTIFKELFEEDRDLEGRIDRFKYYMDEMIIRMKRGHPRFRESWHHQDNSIISYYLALRFPLKYIYYHPNLHQSLVTSIGAKPLVHPEDIIRYFKMTITLSTFLFRNNHLVENHEKRLYTDFVPNSRLIVYEWIVWLTGEDWIK